MSDISKLKRMAEKALSESQDGKLYTKEYVIARLNNVLASAPNDYLVRKLADSIPTVNKSMIVSQREIGSLFNKLAHVRGSTVFNDNLRDLLPNSMNFDSGVTRKESSLRVGPRDVEVTKYKDDGLAKALETHLEVGSRKSISSIAANSNENVRKVVTATLKSLSLYPDSMMVVANKDDVSIVDAYFKRKNGTVAVRIPVRTAGNVAFPPDFVLSGGEFVNLTNESVSAEIRLLEKSAKYASVSKYAGQRNLTTVDLKQYTVPDELKVIAGVENAVTAAMASFSRDNIVSALNVADLELKSIGANAELKLGKVVGNVLNVDANVKVAENRFSISIPVEFVNNQPLIPSKFAFDGKEYPLTKKAFNLFANDKSTVERSHTLYRDNGPMKLMKYNQLVDQITSGVVSGDYRRAEDALRFVGDKFANHYASALDHYSTMLKQASVKTESSRDILVKEAINRGDLVKLSTSLEWFSPKLRLPLSKIAFNEDGEMVSLHRFKLDAMSKDK